MSGQKPGFDEQFCPSCGSIVNEEAPYCPECGHPISPKNRASNGSTNSGDIEIGYETIEEKRAKRAKKAKEVGNTVVENSSSILPVVKSATLWIIGLFLILGGIGSFGSPELSPVVGVPLLFIGLLLLPPVHGLFGRDADPLSFGSRKTIEEKTVLQPAKPCIACASPVEEGVQRDRVKQFLVFGGAVLSSVEGQSIYCQNCARGEVAHLGGESKNISEKTQTDTDQESEIKNDVIED